MEEEIIKKSIKIIRFATKRTLFWSRAALPAAQFRLNQIAVLPVQCLPDWYRSALAVTCDRPVNY
jgi:hypothetical protein